MKWIAVVLCMLAGFAVAQESDEQLTQVRAARDAGQATELQYAEAVLAYVKRTHPHDYEAHTHEEYRVFLATQLEEKKITPAEFRYRWAERNNAFIAARADLRRNAEATQRQRLDSQQAAEQSQRDGATAIMLQGIGNAFRNAHTTPGVNCTSTNYGGTVMTNCN